MSTKKIKFQIENETYELPQTTIREWNGKTRIDVSHAAASSLVRQFAKKFFPQYVVRVSSSSFANGNSLDVYVSTKTGGEVPRVDFQKISGFANLWEYGRFDGMTDCYESYDTSGTTSDNGTEIHASVKYVHVNNRPKFGTVEAILNEVLNQGREFEEATKYYTDSTTKGAVPKAKLILDKIMDGTFGMYQSGRGITLTKIG